MKAAPPQGRFSTAKSYTFTGNNTFTNNTAVNATLTSTSLEALTNPLYNSNGIYSALSKGAAPVSLVVGASPYTYTNPYNYNLMIYIAGGVVTALGYNGSTLASGLTLSGVVLVTLKPSEYVTVTYTTVPAMFFVPM